MTRSPLLSNFRSPAALACFVLTAAIGLGIDLFSKAYAFDHLAHEGVTHTSTGAVRVVAYDEIAKEYQYIPKWLHFRAMANQGAVFGLGQGQRVLFLFVSVAAVVFIGYLFAASGRQRLYQFILGLLLAGVLGNMYDRTVFGYVRDMIYIFPRQKIGGREVFPWIFNVADSMLCVGVGLIFIYSLFSSPRRDPERATRRAADSPARAGSVAS